MNDDFYAKYVDEAGDDEGGSFDLEQAETNDPKHWLMVSVISYVVAVSLILVPVAILIHKKCVRGKKEENRQTALLHASGSKVKTNFFSVTRFDQKSIQILSYSIPFTLSSVTTALCECVLVALISWYIGTEQVIAFCESLIILHLAQELLKGPIYANPSVCSQCVAQGNNYWAGQYVQISIGLYWIFALPVAIFWCTNIYELITYFEWGDKYVAKHSQQFTRYYIWSIMVDASSEAILYLLDVTDHEMFTTAVRLGRSITNVGVLALLIFFGEMFLSIEQVTLPQVGILFLASSVVFMIGSILIAYCRGWLEPFREGLVSRFAFLNPQAVKNVLQVAVPLSVGSVLANAEVSLKCHKQ